jgi:hypothetical protein
MRGIGGPLMGILFLIIVISYIINGIVQDLRGIDSKQEQQLEEMIKEGYLSKGDLSMPLRGGVNKAEFEYLRDLHFQHKMEALAESTKGKLP